MYETIRIVGKLRPKYILWENVKNILSKKHKHNFDAYIETMNVLGYNSYYQVLNAKDYGIPQNRERVYTISIRKDIDKSNFMFPEKEELKLRLKDMLEDEVEEKYYLSDKAISGLQRQENLKHKPNYIENKEICNTIDTKVGDGTHYSPYIRDLKDPKCIRVGGIFDTENSKHQAGSIYDKDGLCPTLDTMEGGWRQPCIEIKNATKKGYDEAIEGDSINLSYPDSNTRRGRVGHQVSQTLQCNDSMGVVTQHETLKNKLCNELIDKGIVQGGEIINHSYTNSQQRDTLDKYIETTNGITPTLTTRADILGYVDNKNTSLRIRKLTPKECWRLMGFSDEDFEKAANIPTSNAQLYKQAGNSIVVNVLVKIFKNLF